VRIEFATQILFATTIAQRKQIIHFALYAVYRKAKLFYSRLLSHIVEFLLRKIQLGAEQNELGADATQANLN